MRRTLLLTMLFVASMACEREDLYVQHTDPDTSDLIAGSKLPVYIIRLQPAAAGLEPRTAGAPDPAVQISRLAQELCARVGVADPGRIHGVYAAVFQGFAAALDPQEVALMRRQKEVDAVEQETNFAIQQLAPGRGNYVALPAQIVPWGVEKLRTKPAISTQRAWIMDTGIDLDHPDLNVDADRSRCFLPWTYYELDPNDLNGHGTHVAGTIAALDNQFGISGIAPGASVVAVKVLSKNGIGPLSSVLRGLDYILTSANPGDVVNISLSGNGSRILDAAVERLGQAGIRVVIAAGNHFRDIATVSPARVNAPNVYTVSAINKEEVFAPFSNYGQGVDFAEPGVDITSTYVNGSYAVLSGTSMAAPHLSGLLLIDNKIKMTTMGYAKGDPDGVPDPIAGQ